MNSCRTVRLLLLASLGVTLAMCSVGCSSDSTTSAQFASSTTAAAPGLVKLVEKSHEGSRVTVDAVLFGPEPGLDLFQFKLGIRIGDSALVRFVSQPAGQTALIADDGQTIAIDVDGFTDPSVVGVEVKKLGGGAGNGVATASAVIVEVTFEVQGAGTTTLSFVGLDGGQPQALDSHLVPIAAVTFDAASAGVIGVTSGGGGY
jgi:hypothetical protein